MKTIIILKATGEKVQTHKETADILIKMGRAMTEEQMAIKAANAAAEVLKYATKINGEAEQRQTKVIDPEKNKLEKPKRGRPKKK